MTFNLNYFLAALALLWIPLPCSLTNARTALYHERVETATLTGLLRAWQNWVDLVRAPAGTWLLLTLSISPDPIFPGSPAQILQLQLAILLVGVTIQSIRLGSELSFFSPVFYLTGMSVVLGGYWQGGFAAVCAWTMAIGTRDFRYVLPTLAVGLMLAGAAFGMMGTPLVANLVFVLLPPALALICQKRLWFLALERRRSGRRVLEPATVLPEPAKAGAARKLKPAVAAARRGA